ncbi:MAG: Cobalt-zinc-cadmium resistance protein [Rhizobacter sp.]|nr:Cobalt-zinc-cadmium resistance protein [Rhizobacter sp.]
MSAARHEIEAADGAFDQAGVRPNPELSLAIEDLRRDTRTTSAIVGFPIELGGKREARLAQARLGREVALAELRGTQADVRSAVIAAFFKVLVAQERQTLAKASVDIARRASDVTARRVAAGKVSPVDETRSRVEQSNAEIEAIEAAGELDEARRALAATWRSGEPDFAVVQGDLEALPERGDFQSLSAELDTSPALVASRLQADHSRAAIDVERSKRIGDLAINVGAKRDNELGLTQAVIGVSIPLPLFDRNRGAIAQATQRAARADDLRQAARVQAALDLQQSLGRLSRARATAQALRDTVLPGARLAADAAARGFEAGKFGLLDVLDTQRALLAARVRHIAALQAAFEAAAAIDHLLGRDTP